jgi:hypothetical protein
VSKEQFLQQNQRNGEIYVGLILGKNGDPDYHLFLLPGDNDPSNWKTQIDWAKSIGGDLPNRREQSLLIANAKEHFKADWYWSSEQHAADSDCAWYQYFDDGYQDSFSLSDELRARAVRRLVIQ